MAGYETLSVEKRGQVDWLTLNRPDSLNAIDTPLVTELGDYFGAGWPKIKKPTLSFCVVPVGPSMPSWISRIRRQVGATIWCRYGVSGLSGRSLYPYAPLSVTDYFIYSWCGLRWWFLVCPGFRHSRSSGIREDEYRLNQDRFICL